MREFGGESGAHGIYRFAVYDGLEAGDFGIAFQDLKTHADFVNAVVERLQLGRLVYNVFRRGDFAAIVQPGGDVHCFPFVFVEAEVFVQAAALFAGGARQHLGEFRNAGAVPSGVGALGVNGAGDQLDHCFKKQLLCADQGFGFQRDGR